LVSIYVRLKDADFRGFVSCYTCGKKFHWKELQAGHYIHGKGDFNTDNLKPQCPRCNKWLSGNLGKYAEHLLKDYGEAWLEQLRKEVEKQGNYYTMGEVKLLLEIFKARTDALIRNSR
jgi:NAD-dependent SIR2 family protein deacetylase